MMRFYSLLLLCCSAYCGSISGQTTQDLIGLSRQAIIDNYGRPESYLESSQKAILIYPQGRIILKKGAVVSSSGHFGMASTGISEPKVKSTNPEVQDKAPAPTNTGHKTSDTSAKIPSAFRWSLLLADAKKRSGASSLPILVLFTGPDWCPPCIQLEKEVLDEKKFKEYVRQNFIPLKVALYRQSPQSAASKAQYDEMRDEYKINGVPNFVIISNEGELLRRPDIFKQYKGAKNREDHVIAAIMAAGASGWNVYLKIGFGVVALIAVIMFVRK